MTTARTHYEHLDAATLAALLALIPAGTIPLSALAPLTASRVVVSDGSGVLSPNGALTSGKLVRANGTGSLADDTGVVNADVGAAAAIAYSKLNLATSIVNADVAAAAAIAFSKMAALTTDRALVSNSSGVVSTSALTAAQLAAAACAVTDTGRIDLTLSANSLSADLVAGGVRTVDLAAQAAGTVNIGSPVSSFTISSSSYQDAASITYTPKSSASRVLLLGWGVYVHTSGTTTITLRRGTTVIDSEFTYISTLPVLLMAVDSSHGGSSTTWNYSVKNTTPAGTMVYLEVAVVDLV